MATIALISCTKSKRDYPCRAREMYGAKSPWSARACSLAQLVADQIYFLSARHGLLPEDQVIEPYSEALGDKSREEQRQ